MWSHFPSLTPGRWRGAGLLHLGHFAKNGYLSFGSHGYREICGLALLCLELFVNRLKGLSGRLPPSTRGI